jgi:hypothetical protein
MASSVEDADETIQGTTRAEICRDAHATNPAMMMTPRL